MISKTLLRFGLFDDTNVSHSSSHQPMIIVDKVYLSYWILLLHIQVFLINSFVPNNFQGVEKGCIGKKWVKKEFPWFNAFSSHRLSFPEKVRIGAGPDRKILGSSRLGDGT